jgi:hypothetical protein
MGPCIAIVNVEGCFYMSERLANRSFIGHFDEYTADMGPRYIGVGTGIETPDTPWSASTRSGLNPFWWAWVR